MTRITVVSTETSIVLSSYLTVLHNTSARSKGSSKEKQPRPPILVCRRRRSLRSEYML